MAVGLGLADFPVGADGEDLNLEFLALGKLIFQFNSLFRRCPARTLHKTDQI